MATKRGLLAVLLAFGLLAAACSSDNGGGGSTGNAGSTGNENLPTLKIGIPLPFTGVVAESAEEMRQTFEMYVEQHDGKLGGLPVDLTFEDTETDAELVVTKTRKLINEDQVDIISGPMLAFEGLAMIDSVNKAGIPWVGQTGVTASELRPGGTCEFAGGERVACAAEQGVIPSGTSVRVIAVVDGRPVVRPA